ncbi:hypothetical protein DRO03_10280 [Methanosarcinales archaeon]|nr:MAG: hypothetical protein DRO03_10280 [Methanosarcinales archaeon]
MCQLVKNIDNKASAIAITVHSKEESYEVLKAIDSFKGAVIAHHISEFFEGNETKGLEDIVANTNESLDSLKRSLVALKDRLAMKAEVKRLREVAQAEEQKAQDDKDRKVAQNKQIKLDRLDKQIDETSEKVIAQGLGGGATTIKEKVEILDKVEPTATTKEVKAEREKYLIITALKKAHPSMNEWTRNEAILASRIGGLRGNVAHKEVAELIDPTTAEVAELRLSILTKKKEANQAHADNAERDEVGGALETHKTEAYKEAMESIEVEAEEANKADKQAMFDNFPLPTERFNIPKGRLKAKDRNDIIQALFGLGLTEDNLKQLGKELVKKYN